MKQFRLLTLTFCLTLASCATNDRARDEGPSVGEREKRAEALKREIDLGREMAARLAGTMGVVLGQKELTEYLNLVAATLARGTSRPEISYRVGILKSKAPNAYATPGGYLFVTEGLLKSLKSEHELAAILGHEIAHVTERHIFNEVFKETSFVDTLARSAGGGGGAVAAGLSKAANQGLEVLLDTGYGAEKESESDQVGMMLAAAAGYKPDALIDVLKRLAPLEGSSKLDKTHPPFSARIQALEQFSLQQGFEKTTIKTKEAVLNARFKFATRGLK